MHASWQNHPLRTVAEAADALPMHDARRIIALKTLAVRAGLPCLGWSDEQLESLLADGIPGAPAVQVTQVTGTDEAAVKRIVDAAIAAHEAATPSPRVVYAPVVGERREVPGRAHVALVETLAWATPLYGPDGSIVAPGENVMLVGPAGSGKSTLADQVAVALGFERARISSAVSRASQLLGYVNPATGNVVRTPFREAFEHGGVFLFDEIDASVPDELMAFNQALANRRCAFPDAELEAHPRFVCIATANTFGHGATRVYAGRQQLDGATLERFTSVECNYDEAMERDLAPDADWCARVQLLRAAAAKVAPRLLVTPRATFKGGARIAVLMASGMSREDAWRTCEGALIWRGAAADVVEAVRTEAAAMKARGGRQ